MTLTVDNLDTITGWVASDIVKFHIEFLNEIKDYIANDLSGSILIHSIDGSGETLTKTLTAIDVTDYQELVISIYSVKLGNTGWWYNDLDDFNYKIRFNGTMDYYMIPTFSSLQPVTFDISSETEIDRIQLMCNHDTEDYLVVNWCVINKDQLPLDIYSSLKTKLETEVTRLLSNGYYIEDLDLAAGDTEITFSVDMPYIEKYACVYITDGINSESHQLLKGDELNYTMSSMYDGKSIINDYTGASCYVLPKVEYGLQREIALPCIFISNLAPRFERSGKIEWEYDSYKTDRTLSRRRLPQILKWSINIDCISRHNSILADLSEVVRKTVSPETLWLNGKKFQVYYEGDPVFQDFTDAAEIYPKITYVMELEMKEYFVDREALPNTTTINTSLEVEANI
jgi:hypothetical protein